MLTAISSSGTISSKPAPGPSRHIRPGRRRHHPITNGNTDPARRDAKVTSVNSTSAIATQAVADKNTSRANANKHARALAARIKAHLAYTVALGSLLGIVGAEDTTDLTTSKPTLAGVDQTGGVVELDFDKSISDGVNMN